MLRLAGASIVATLALAFTGCSSEPEENTSPPVRSSDPASSSDSLDEAGKNACYLFFKWTEDATILNADEMHDRVKEIWDGGSGFTGTSGAKDSSNSVIREGVRRMLEAEVASDIEGLAQEGFPVGEECQRLAP